MPNQSPPSYPSGSLSPEMSIYGRRKSTTPTTPTCHCPRSQKSTNQLHTLKAGQNQPTTRPSITGRFIRGWITDDEATEDEAAYEPRRERSLKTCWRYSPNGRDRRDTPRESKAFTPQMSTRVDRDQNLTAMARVLAHRLCEITYRDNRKGRYLLVTISYLPKAMHRCDRSIQRLALAAAHELAGGQAAVIDLDPQGSATVWGRLREGVPPVVIAAHPPRLARVVDAAVDAGASLVVTDTAPREAGGAAEAARLAGWSPRGLRGSSSSTLSTRRSPASRK